jgi:tRNA (cmo5U34)-methyltransferase
MHKLNLKLKLKIFNALKTNGQYIECDYMVESQQEEAFYYNENKRIRKV